MIVSKQWLIIGFFVLICFCCKRKQYICPAYNTYFIHDKEERDQLFSPFVSDSLKEEPEGGTTATDANADEKSSAQFLDTFWENKGSNSKFQPKERLYKKMRPNGLLIANAGKSRSKMRNVGDIEMKVIMIKPLARYSNIDSTTAIKGQETPSDTL